MSLWKLLTAAYDSSGNNDKVRIDASTNTIQTIGYPHHEIHGGSHYYIEAFTTLATAGTLYVKLVTPDTTKTAHFKWLIKSNGILETNLYENPSGGMANGARPTIHANNRNINCESGTHTPAGSSATILTDSTKAWVVDALIGLQVFNQTDGSSGIITDNDATTVTVAALLGGTDNDWDQDDVYEINNSQLTIISGVDVATTKGLNVSTSKVGGTGFKSTIGGSASIEDEIILRQNTTYFREFISSSDDNIISLRAFWYEHTPKH